MAGLKLTVGISLPGYTPTESIYLTSGVSPSDGLTLALKYLTARAQLLGGYASISFARISTFPASRFVQEIDPTTYPSASKALQAGEDAIPDSSATDRAQSNLLIYMTGAPYSRRMYLSGVPDQVLGVGVTYPRGFFLPAVSWNTPWAAFQRLLGDPQFSFRVRNKAQDVFASLPLVPIGVGPTLYGVTAPGPLAGVSVGSDVYLSGWRRISTHYEGLNGSWRVVGINVSTPPATTVTYVLGSSGNVNPTNFYGPGKIGPAVYMLQPIDAGSVVAVKAVNHKRGGRVGLVRGRSLPRS